MALVYKEKCEYHKTSEDSIKCDMLACIIQGGRFQTLHCEPFSLSNEVKSISSDLSTNTFKYNISDTNVKSHQGVFILSDSNQDEIAFLYEHSPNNQPVYPKTYLCRFRPKEHEVTICSLINPSYIGKTLSFNSADITDIKKEMHNRNVLKTYRNPRHKFVRLRYDNIFFSKDTCHEIMPGHMSEYICRYSICKKDHEDHASCVDAKFNGKLIHLQYHLQDERDKKYIYLPKKCIKKDTVNECTPYLCEYKNLNELNPCRQLDISIVSNVKALPENSAMQSTKTMALNHEGNLNSSALIAITFIPFLVMFFFIWAYINKALKKKKIEKSLIKDKEP